MMIQFQWAQIPFCDLTDILQINSPVMVLLIIRSFPFFFRRLKEYRSLTFRSAVYIAVPLIFGIGLIVYMSKTTSNGGNDVVLFALLLLLSGISLFLFSKELNSIREEQMEARFAWMKHSLDAHSAFLHDELHRYQMIGNFLDHGQIEQAKNKLHESSEQLTVLFHDLACNSLPLSLALMERKKELDHRKLKISTTILCPDLPGLSLPAQFDLYLNILDFVLEYCGPGVLSIHQEKNESHIILTVAFSMKENAHDQFPDRICISGYPTTFSYSINKGKLILAIP